MHLENRLRIYLLEFYKYFNWKIINNNELFIIKYNYKIIEIIII